jgi:AraC family transcriptional regulator
LQFPVYAIAKFRSRALCGCIHWCREGIEKTMTPQVWQPTEETAFALRDVSILRGGPEAATLPEHSHSEVQVSVHFGPVAKSQPEGAAVHTHLYASKQPHSGGWRQGSQVVVFQLSQEMLAQAGEELLTGATFEIRPFNARREKLFEELAHIMLHEFERPDRISRFYAESVAQVVAGHILRAHSETRPRLKPPNALSTTELLSLRRFIYERIETGFTVTELANIVGLGPQRFARKLRLATGLSPWRYVQEYRITRAQKLLRGGCTPIVEISNSLGFASQSHFTNTFRNNVGVTPNTYRNKSR